MVKAGFISFSDIANGTGDVFEFSQCRIFLILNSLELLKFSEQIITDSMFQELSNYFNKMIDFNDSLSFSDARHLNQNGVQEYNEFFIKFLRSRLNRSK